MDDISLNRICSDCKDEIIIYKEKIDEVVLYDGAYYHKDCFVNMCNKKLQSKRCKKIKWQSALNELDVLCEEARLNLGKEFEITKRKQIEFAERLKKKEELAKKRKIAASKNSIEQKEAKDLIFHFILNNYNVTCLPQYIFIKLNSIYSGTFKGMSTGILPTELLDMWQRKIDYLNKVADKNVTKGKPMNSVQRINYDLSILVNKYDSYKKWVESQKILESDNSRIKESSSIGTSIIKEVSKKDIDKNEDGQIIDLVDDIFS